MATVRIEHVTKRFGDTVAVDDISLDVADGIFMVLLGPSGCGKTTTLRMIAGLEHPTRGDIYIGSRRVNDLSPADRDIAFVFQFYALYPHLNVYDNIAFPLRAQHVPKSEIDQRVHRIARILKIESLLSRRINQLGSGEQQRTALARAMIREPQVLLMDEPLTNLDAQLRSEMRTELKHLQHERHTTTIYVTHDQVEAMAMADLITVMNLGKIMQIGRPMEVYNHPANLFVAGFVGTPPMNFIQGECTNGTVRSTSITVPLTDGASKVVAEKCSGRKVIIGVRPEDVHLEPTTAENGVARAEVYAVEPLGDETLVNLQLGEEQVRTRLGPLVPYRPGDIVSVTLDPKKLHIFDAQTEQAIL
jgi:multiple sugar transport system ATP-binding protein